MKLAINNSDNLSEYLKIKYDIPRNTLLIFSFDTLELYNNSIITLAAEDVPEEWNDAIPLIRKTLDKITFRATTINIPTFGKIDIWE